MAYVLPLGLGLVAALFFVIVSAEVFYLFYWRKRPSDRPRLNNVTVAPVNESEQLEARDQSRAAVVIDVTCAEYQISTLQQDLVEKLFPSLSSASHEVTHHTMVGPPRMLFTIREETMEELEGLDMEMKACGGRSSRKSSRSKSMGDIPLSPPRTSCLSPVGTPFTTPFSSPDIFSSSPYGTPTRCFSPLTSLSSHHAQSDSVSPILHKPTCRVMYDYPNNASSITISPPLAPPSPTRPTFSFLASRNVPISSKRPGNLSKGPLPVPKATSAAPAPAPSSSGRKPLFQHLASSPIHKQAECVIKPPSPLRACTYVNEYHDDDEEDDSSTPAMSPQSSSPDRSPGFFSTPITFFDPVNPSAAAEVLVSPSSKGSVFNRRLLGSNVLSPFSSPSDCDSTYASPLLVIPSRSSDVEGEGESEHFNSPASPTVVFRSSDAHQIIRGEEECAASRRESVLSPVVLPSSFSFQASRSRAHCFHPIPPSMISSQII